MLTQQTSNPNLWNQVWSQSSHEKSEFWEWVERESNGFRGTKVQDYIRTNVGDISQLKTIEVGSGLGIYSFIFARLGAEVTLLDYSKQALTLAEECFQKHSLKANFILQDALSLNSDLHSRYDVAMSFGTVEHFRYPQRLQMIETHINLVRNGGAIVISVPNKAFFPHEVLKAYLQRKNKWELGYEGAFSRKEFFKLARQLQLSNSKLMGSAFLSDFHRYVQIYRSTHIFQKIFGSNISTSANLQIREKSSWLDDYFGADLVLLGINSQKMIYEHKS
ncbi:methyltransferase domain-containing protein [Plectonema cf. radiosum LEGE 06105]|uniref:Methyltransferase domain-containing protein n=1 Tax=Plectonema cf. radiosum LEGE 06105 TaxID=945769 RepID=A0A8J7K3T4_9CYAN|nr:class I SAM-dependent methyltransferase [Plectonema radiosum]MBE9214512.1 methyltransferase domain-containing protein [Plectonema cf. radiosum LEGE 06105]